MRLWGKGCDELDVISIGLDRFADKGGVMHLPEEYPDEIVELKEKIYDTISFLDLYIKDSEKTGFVKDVIAEKLADFILEHYENSMFNKAIATNYFYFSTAEKKEILQKAISYLNCEKKVNCYSDKAKTMIRKKIREYFDVSNEIIVDGFVTFRLQDFQKEMESIIDQAVDDYLVDREYKEFISLLQYFVELQPSLLDTVHVTVNDDGNYELYDEEQSLVKVNFAKGIEPYSAFDSLTPDDLLVSRLITLSPKKIVVHRKERIENKELLNTLMNVFGEKFSFCKDDCPLCNKNTLDKPL